ncbi:unnamed protein product [Rotaria sp. Silwood1]|nr:unnamed protein product [Rotaria sp. Silwood1]CAF3417097.1 unnamed protein product [Rotaria sp. Silwood1]CAF3456432.1 unnamed protein product [Rotaria sp. Silwood1]CAF4584677.1 unnamed protein product [Rotaria sp. Silwood1]CAF4936816.1 unnamed protein product [Rotaria sp. Silwood1]
MASSLIPTSLESTVKLNDGVIMPLFGLGVYLVDENCTDLVAEAIHQGYRLIDTAEFYANEDGVGNGIKQSGKKREDIFVVSKWWPSSAGAKGALKTLDHCLKSIQSNYVDLYLLHAPQGGHCAGAYRALLEAKKQGKIRSLGVSNFGVIHLEALAKLGLEKPSVNQIELHPWQQKKDIVKYCHEHDITVMGYSPLAKGQKIRDKTVGDIANKLSKTPAQILIRWSVQHGYITIPKTSKKSRLQSNADVFNWSIPDEDMKVLNALGDKPWSCTWDPTNNSLKEAGLQ